MKNDYRAVVGYTLSVVLISAGIGFAAGVSTREQLPIANLSPDVVVIHDGSALPEIINGRPATVVYYRSDIERTLRHAFFDDGIGRWMDNETRETLPPPDYWYYDPVKAR